jgi:hypothetical protein
MICPQHTEAVEFSPELSDRIQKALPRKKGIVTNMHKHSSVYMRIFAQKWVLTLTPNMLAYRTFDVLLKSNSAAVGLNMTLHAVSRNI